MLGSAAVDEKLRELFALAFRTADAREANEAIGEVRAAGEQEGQEYHPRLVPAVTAVWLVVGVCIYLFRQLWSRTQEQ